MHNFFSKKRSAYHLFLSSLISMIAVTVLVIWFSIYNYADGRNDSLLVDMSIHQIEIDSVFSGTSLLLFGATDRPGNIIIILRGPDTAVKVRRKRREAGIWINSRSIEFDKVPQFYSIASSSMGEVLLKESQLKYYQVGTENIYLKTQNPKKSIADVQAFSSALLRVKTNQKLYPTVPGRVSFIDTNLFRASIDIPSNIPVGDFSIVVLLVANGEVVSEKRLPLSIKKSGLSAEISTFAHINSEIYALIALITALLAGWVGNLFFRKV